MREGKQWLFYVSRSARGIADAEVQEIVRISQARNLEKGLTGMLLFTGAHFAQVLEGDPAQLDPLFEAILADPRHSDVRVLGREPLARRR